MKIKTCRACLGTDLEKFLDLGMHPPSDAFLKQEHISNDEPTYPLDVFFCKTCSLMQLGHIVPPELMYNKDYVYVTGVSKTMIKHFGEVAKDAMEKFGEQDNFVVEMGSNDGTMLKHFKQLGAKTLGVDPSQAAQFAIKDGIDTVTELFNEKTAKEVVEKHGKAHIIIGANVFAHIDDWSDLMRGVDALLEDEGVLIFEFPYGLKTVQKLEYDQIYHEHLSYVTLKPITILCQRFGMEVFDAIESEVHGGSIRVFIARSGKRQVNDHVHSLLRKEEENGLYTLERYQKFAADVENHRKEFVALLKDLKTQGKKIIGNGAAAKGNTLLNYCKIGTDIMDCIVDPNPIKHDMYTPGMKIPVYPLERVTTDKPDYMIILPWNFQDVIMQQEQRIREWGGKFIVPLPEPKIL